MTKQEYLNYLQSPQWRAKTRLIWKRQRGKCGDCQDRMTQTHHLTYDNLGDEPLEDLLGVCDWCHKERHDLNDPWELDEWLYQDKWCEQVSMLLKEMTPDQRKTNMLMMTLPQRDRLNKWLDHQFCYRGHNKGILT